MARDRLFGPLGPDGVVWECPDLVPLPQDGDPAQTRWVLLLSTNPVGTDPDPVGSMMHYVVGSFDGVDLHPYREELDRFDHGRDFYAGVTFDSAPDGEAILLAWMNNWRYAHAVPAATWRGAMSLPRRLALRTVEGQPRMVQHPVASIEGHLSHATLRAPSEPITLIPHALIEVGWHSLPAGGVLLRLTGDGDENVHIVCDPANAKLTVTRGGTAARAWHTDFPSSSGAPLRRSPARGDSS